MRRVFFLFYFLFLLIIISPYTLSANRKCYTVFSDGKSDYVIVVSSQASESEKFAASELQSCIEEISGALLPIVECGKGKKGGRIIIGHNNDSQKIFCGEKERHPDDDSFTYKSKKGDIVIIGGSERGTMYGVFAFLENELGCRWLAEDCTIIPHKDEYHFSILNHFETPAFPRRSVLYNGCKDVSFRTFSRINERIKTSPSKIQKQVGGTYGFLSPHTMIFILPVSEYYEKHPDYFALVNGVRIKDKPQPCFSNPDVFYICVEKLRKIMRNYPELSIYEVSPLDNENRCQCHACQETVKLLGSYTDLVLDFVNRVAEEVADEFPDKKIEFLAYMTTCDPPVKVEPHENVVVRLCNSWTCHLHGFEKCSSDNASKFQSNFKRWRKLAKDFYVWEYASDFSWYFIPFPNFYALRDNLVFYKKNQVKGVFVEGNHSTSKSEFQALRVYVLSKLLWNPECDLDKIVDDFMSGYYGAAAPYMRQYFDLIHSRITDNIHMGTFAKYYEEYYKSDIIVPASDIFEKAKQVADNDLILQRIEIEELSINLLKTILTPSESKKDGTFEKVNLIMGREGARVGSKNSEKIYERRVVPNVSYNTPGGRLIDGPCRVINSSFSWLKDWYKTVCFQGV